MEGIQARNSEMPPPVYPPPPLHPPPPVHQPPPVLPGQPVPQGPPGPPLNAEDIMASAQGGNFLLQ